MVEHEKMENEKILPKVQEGFSKATKALSECIVAMESVNSWYCSLFSYLVYLVISHRNITLHPADD